MATQSEFMNVPVPVLNRSGFDKSHQNLLTSKVGMLTPVLVDELIPDSTIKLKAACLAKLPPLASDTFMRVKMHLEAFFVPYRILFGGFTYALGGQVFPGASSSTQSSVDRYASARMPVLTVQRATGVTDPGGFQKLMGPGTLPDYLGFKLPVSNPQVEPTSDNPLRLNIFPFLAYHRIYDDWYRNALIETPLFSPSRTGNAVSALTCLPYSVDLTEFSQSADPVDSYIPYLLTFNSSGGVVTLGTSFGPGRGNIFTLRQRNFGKDYFTSASPRPTLGAMPVLEIDTSGSTGSFTIGALRSINSLTQFAERNALAGPRYDDYLKTNYGVKISSKIEGRAQYLGRMVFDVYSKGVAQTANDSNASDATRNPFKSVGAQYGDAVGTGEDTLVDDFYVEEPGVLMVLASFVPKVTYSSGASRLLRHFTGAGWKSDIANQVFENVGPQPIYKSELDGNLMFGSDKDSVFGYTDRYAEFKTKFDECHGLFHDGQTLEAFALQRTFGSTGATLNKDFIEIPTSYLDQVSAVADAISQFGYWLDCAFDYKVVQPLSRYSQPSLVLPADLHGHYEKVRRGGSHL